MAFVVVALIVVDVLLGRGMMIPRALSGAHDRFRDSLFRRLGERSEWNRHHARADRKLQVMITTTCYVYVDCLVCLIDW